MRVPEAPFAHDLLSISFALLITLGVVVLVSLSYCLFLLYVAWRAARRLDRARQFSPVIPARIAARFCILIPAHNEEVVIGSVLGYIAKQERPAGSVRIVVIADNCDDGTAAIAGGFPGIEVWERRDDRLRGKPNALNWALERLSKEGGIDAVVIMDADTFMEPGYLAAMDAALVRAGGRQFAAQGWYAVLNPEESWRTSLMAGALGLVHYVRPLAREALGLSVGLKGNGMCFSADLLDVVSWRGASLTEDIELGLDLVEKHGVRVRFVPGAVVRAQMPTSRAAAATQRRRWEHGRHEIVRRRAMPMFVRGLLTRNWMLLDASLDLLIPPVAEIGAFLLAWGGVTLLIASLGARPILPMVAWTVAAAGFMVYILGGFRLSGAPAEAYRALLAGPFYMVWKIVTVLPRPKRLGRKEGWVRTQRKEIAPVEPGANENVPAGTPPDDKILEARRK
ncbi:MAG: glycosyltransferase family 2 protein [Capsulimonadaceae bacterium]|nr:glycosyltransferase family 2 protein [Capsulimonadaceae bacterium]